jgi:hypothetical protein
VISAARELVARFADALPRWRDPYPPHPADRECRWAETADARAVFDDLLAAMDEAEAPRPARVEPRPEPADPPPPTTDPGRYDKPYAGFIPPHLDKKGPFGHVPGCRCGPGQTAPSATCGMPAWAALTGEEQA